MSRVPAGRMRSLSIVFFLTVSAALLLGVGAASARPVPARFFGVVPQGELGEADFDRMQGVVGTLRIPFYWYEIEPRPGAYDFARLDAVVGEAADRGIAVLPFV